MTTKIKSRNEKMNIQTFLSFDQFCLNFDQKKSIVYEKNILDANKGPVFHLYPTLILFCFA